MPLFRSAIAQSASSVSFKAPRLAAALDEGKENPQTEKERRVVFYPPAKGRTVDEIANEAMTKRLAKCAEIDYHAPPPTRKLHHPAPSHVPEDGTHECTSAVTLNKDQPTGPAHATSPSTNAAAPNNSSDDADAEAVAVVSQLPISPSGKRYFQVSLDDDTSNFESTGIIVVDTMLSCAQLFDRSGRQYGNRPDPGYSLRNSEVEAVKAGRVLHIGSKVVLLVTALPEDAFRSGEFFLRKEHDTRKKEERKRAEAQCVPRKSKITFGGSLFSMPVFRKRPREGGTGFAVPLKGRLKGEARPDKLVSLYDADAPNAVVLFRADYKRDANGRLIRSVVVNPVIGEKLRPHQRAGVKFLYDCVTGERMAGYFGAILADEMGLGKTIQTIAIIYTCLKDSKFGDPPIARKCLVVAPSSLVRNWCNEFDKWLGPGTLKCFAISESTPKGDRILSRFDGEGDILVISYDQLRKYVSRLSGMKFIELVVCDEGHRLKNSEIKTAKAVASLPTRRRIVLSGTPIQNDLAEFHAMVEFVNPGILGGTDLFKRVFEEPIMIGRDPSCDEAQKDLGAERAHYLANLTQKFILRRTQTINEKYLPPKVDVTVFCRLSPLQQKAYTSVCNIASGYASSPLILISALKKLCNHLSLLYDATRTTEGGCEIKLPKSVFPKEYAPGRTSTEASSSKIHFVSLLLDELVTKKQLDKVVIVSNYTQSLDIIARLCETKKIPFFQLDGATPIRKRQELVDRFNIPASQEIVFLLSSKAGGVGLNLIGANRLILFDPDWNPANDAQAMGRIWRDGQKQKVFLYRLLCTGTIEEKIFQRQVSKQGLSANVVDLQEDSRQHFSLEELQTLFQFRGDTNCDTHDLLNCKCLRSESTRGVGEMKFKRVGMKSGPRMDELKGWRHIGDAKQFTLDPVVSHIAARQPNLISFVFANERDAQKIQELATERQFVADEENITCGTQQQEELSADSIIIIDDSDGDDDGGE